MSVPPRYSTNRHALFTDLYEVAMLKSYFAEQLNATAVFELFYRELPPGRKFVVAAGLDDVLDYLEHLRFSDDDLDWLDRLGDFNADFLDALASFRFTGDVFAVPEGTVVFPHEPLIQVIAPLPEAQLAETFALNQVHIQTLIATKAARVRLAAGDRPVVDFGTRRAHGFDAALKAARAAYLAGLAGTSNILAARRYGVPCVGTMAHSYVQAHDSELEAFEKFSRLHPGTTLLVDTYDTLEGVRKVIEMANRDMARFDVDSIRMDSGDIAALAARSRSMLDDAGLDKVKILASGGLDEYEIRGLVTQNAPVDGFGIGTELVVSGDAPHVDLSYKLVEYAGTPRMKLSPGKTSLPGRKQVFRRSSAGRFTGDTLAASHERHAGEPMLVQVMRQGSRTEAGKLTLDEARERCARELDSLPEALRALEPHAAEARYPVVFSEYLARSKRRIEAGLKDSLQGTTVNL